MGRIIKVQHKIYNSIWIKCDNALVLCMYAAKAYKLCINNKLWIYYLNCVCVLLTIHKNT